MDQNRNNSRKSQRKVCQSSESLLISLVSPPSKATPKMDTKRDSKLDDKEKNPEGTGNFLVNLNGF